MEKKTLNAAAFFVFDEAGKLTAGGAKVQGVFVKPNPAKS